MKPSALAVTLALLGINGLSYFIFPGHTYLTSDSQIYIPMLEHLWDPSNLSRDLIATNPHLSFTIYDELAAAGRKLSGLGFDQVLPALHFTARMAGVWGIWLIFRAWGFSALLSILGTSCFCLGAFVHGPSVLTWELEPVPRTMALPLLWLAIGLIINDLPKWGAFTAALAFLIHPTTVWPVWIVLAALIVHPPHPIINRERWKMAFILACAVILLAVMSRFQAGEQEKQSFFATLNPALENLQRMRASYNWAGTWADIYWGKYAFLLVISLIAARSLHVLAPKSLSWFHGGLTWIGAGSVLFSYLLLDTAKWALGPQVQFARALLFVLAWALLGAIACGMKAAIKGNYFSALLWLYLAYGVPVQVQTWELFLPWSKDVNRMNLLLAMALATSAIFATVLSGRLNQWQRPIAITVLAAASFFAMRDVAKIYVYPKVHTPDLANLARWARTATPADCVFHFPDAKQELYPGLFRGDAVRAIYVDWKSGGQVNFHEKLANQWWQRWQSEMAEGYNTRPIESYAAIADFVVLKTKNRLTNARAIYENGTYLVYQVPRKVE